MRKILAFVAPLSVGACVGPPPVAVAPPVAPPTATIQRPAPLPSSRYTGDWRDWPVTAGTWVYRQDARGSVALFGVPGADADVTLRCDRQARAIYLSRRGSAPDRAPLTIRTSTLTRQVATQPTGVTPTYMAASFNPNDVLLDAIIFSRGRFTIEQATQPTLVIPVWAEVARITEDCRS